MIDYKNDPQIRRLLMRSTELQQFSGEIHQRLQEVSTQLATLIDYEDCLNSYIDELLLIIQASTNVHPTQPASDTAAT